MSETSQTIFGRYQLLDLIAKGGMAEVFKARQDGAAGTEKLVCIKRILPELSRNSDFIKLFVQEAKIVLPLTNGNITQVYDFGEVEGVYYLAMEYVRGQNLALVLKRLAETRKTLEVPAALWIASEVCRGLQYAHNYTNAGGKSVVVVHRDVTPHNMLLSFNGEVKLTDFGIALAASKAQDDDGSVVRGKPCYLAPEQLEGSGDDPRADIFALGASLYEMLTGERPFEGETDAETFELIKSRQVTPPSALNPDVSPELDKVVLKALHKDRERRYQRASDLQVDLSRVLHESTDGGYTAQQLADLLKDLFAWELSQQEGGGEDNVKDRLLFQLSRAGVSVEGEGNTTGELLQMGTVAIGGGGVPRVKRGGQGLVLALVGVFVLLGGAAGVFWALGQGGGGAAADAGPLVLPVQPTTEHLTPPSLRRQRLKAEPIAALPRKDGSSTPGDAKGTANPKTTTKPAARTAKAKVARRRRHAFLNCNSWPWSVVYLNGKRLDGNTPLYGVKVASGRHRLRFVNPELKLSKEVTIDVPAGRIKTVAVRLQN